MRKLAVPINESAFQSMTLWGIIFELFPETMIDFVTDFFTLHSGDINSCCGDEVEGGGATAGCSSCADSVGSGCDNLRRWFACTWLDTLRSLKKFVTFVLTHIGLMCFVVCYCLLGAITFELLERDHELEVRSLLRSRPSRLQIPLPLFNRKPQCHLIQ